MKSFGLHSFKDCRHSSAFSSAVLAMISCQLSSLWPSISFTVLPPSSSLLLSLFLFLFVPSSFYSFFFLLLSISLNHLSSPLVDRHNNGDRRQRTHAISTAARGAASYPLLHGRPIPLSPPPHMSSIQTNHLIRLPKHLEGTPRRPLGTRQVYSQTI